ncbi:MAG: amino acid ABC transporter permease [Propionibacteriaceae bacterium]|jgi:polar amino acid transport system permease protein|nr:amino acid ABC transporter permease [Propionibacteriaceae bacterium]
MALSDIRPTVRRRISRGTSYGVTIVVLALIVAYGSRNWELLSRQFFNGEVFAEVLPNIWVPILNTLLYTVASFVVGTALAIVLALIKTSKGPTRWFAVVFIEVFRGLPAMWTIFAFAYMLSTAFQFRWPGGAIWGGVLALVFVTGAYSAEIVRAGIEAVPKGQREAARSLGMSQLTTTFHVILPQAVRIVIPPLTNEFVMLLKDTALLFIAGATISQRELTTFGRDGLTTYANATPMIVSGLVYLVITVPLTYLVGLLEKKMAVKK